MKINASQTDQEKINEVLDKCLSIEECEKCGLPLEEDELQYCKKCWKIVSKEVIKEAIADVFKIRRT